MSENESNYPIHLVILVYAKSVSMQNGGILKHSGAVFSVPMTAFYS